MNLGAFFFLFRKYVLVPWEFIDKISCEYSLVSSKMDRDVAVADMK